MNRLEALYIQEHVALGMYKSSKNKEEKEFYKKELEQIRMKNNNMGAAQR